MQRRYLMAQLRFRLWHALVIHRRSSSLRPRAVQGKAIPPGGGKLTRAEETCRRRRIADFALCSLLLGQRIRDTKMVSFVAEGQRHMSMGERFTKWNRAALGVMALLAVITGVANAADVPATQGKTEWLETDAGRLKAQIYVSPAASQTPTLLVVLHGDAPFSRPRYHYVFAERAALRDDIVAAAILRPGYSDPSGDTSDGLRGLTNGDNYTADRIAMIVAGVRDLQNHYHPRVTVLVGHSGGAAIAADILAHWPKLAEAALLLSCPCDVASWRQHMKELQGVPIWDQPVESLSPLDCADLVPTSTRIRMMVGADDRVAPPRFTKVYAQRLAARHIDVQVTEIPGEGHEILLLPVVQEALETLVQSLQRPSSMSDGP
jgi:predicted esterase